MSDRGSVTVVALAWVSVVLVVTMGLVSVGRLVAAHTQATAAADAAALAAAPVTFLGGNPRGEAVEFVEANGARLVACRCPLNASFASRVVVVVVQKEVEVPIFGNLTVRARASAEFAPMDLLSG